jgi:carboxymethylenebutenolidase
MTVKPSITQAMIDAYDEYTHTTLDRRSLLKKLTVLAGSAAAATAVLSVLQNNYALAQAIDPADPRIVTETVTYPGGSGDVSGYLARPAEGTRPFPAVVVIHENRGLNPHIQDVARQFAAEGFLAFAPDLLSSLGGTPADSEAAAQLFGQVDREAIPADANAAVAFLDAHELSNGKVAIMGFCFGGGVANAVAVANPDLDAAVIYYGDQPDLTQVANIQARMMFHYGELDERINAGRAAYEEALTAAGVDFQSFTYAGANHAFNNNTNEARYNAEAAALAWSRTIEFLKEVLSA